MYKIIQRSLSHGSSYFTFQILSKGIGLISFPIITRVLTVKDYGLLSIINTMLIFFYAFGKCGISNGIISLCASEEKRGPNIYYNAFLITFTASIILSLTYLISILIAEIKFDLSEALFFVPFFVVVRNVFSINQAYLRARSRITIHNIYDLSIESGSTIIGLIVIVWISASLVCFFTYKVVFESCFVFMVIYLSISKVPLSQRFINIRIIKELVTFGFPLIWLEVSMIIMSFGDRLQIAYLVDSEAVGQYTVAYNLGQYIKQLLAQPIMLAIYPIYNKIWIKEGDTATSHFLTSIISIYSFIAIPIFIYMCLYSSEILVLLASEKYIEASKIVPVVVASTLFNGLMPLLCAGLYLNKETKTISKITCLCALINIGLNFLFIHWYGYFGAAITTAITFFLLNLLIKIKSDLLLRISIPWWLITKIVIYSLVSTMIVFFLNYYFSLNFYLISTIYFFNFYLISFVREWKKIKYSLLIR